MSATPVASFLAARRRRPAFAGVPDSHRPATIEAGYRLQAAIHDALADHWYEHLGYKIGSTSEEGQRTFGLDEPIYAGLFDDTSAASLREALNADFVAPSVECELAVVLGATIDADAVASAPGAALDSVATCHPACEVIDLRYGDPLELGVPTLLADDFFHARFVLGPPNSGWRDLDLGQLGAEVRLDGQTYRGNTADVLSVPDALAWLAVKLGQFGRRLKAGDIVLTGAIVPPVPVRSPPAELSLAVEGFEPLVLDPAA